MRPREMRKMLVNVREEEKVRGEDEGSSDRVTN